MKKAILTLSIVLIGVFTMNAQKTQTPAEKKVSYWSSIVNLTPDEKTKLIPVAETLLKKRAEAAEKKKTDPEAAKKMYKEANDYRDTQLKSILTPEQYTKIQDTWKKNAEEEQEKK